MKLSNIEWCIIAIVITLVMAAEAFNTTIETLVDKLSPGHNEHAGRIKDIAAGAVLITAMGALIVGMIIFVPKFVQLF